MIELKHETVKEKIVQDHLINLAKDLQEDPELAWLWHCNIVKANMEGGYLKWKESNEAACRVMKSLFDVNTSPNFIKLLKTRAPTKVIDVKPV